MNDGFPSFSTKCQSLKIGVSLMSVLPGKRIFESASHIIVCGCHFYYRYILHGHIRGTSAHYVI